MKKDNDVLYPEEIKNNNNENLLKKLHKEITKSWKAVGDSRVRKEHQ